MHGVPVGRRRRHGAGAFVRPWLLGASLAAGVAAGAEPPTCAEVSAFVEARIPEGSKDHVRTLVTCTPATATASLAQARRIVTEWAAQERLHADAAARVGDRKTAVTHLEAALSLDPGNGDTRLALARMRRALALQYLAEADAALKSGKAEDATARYVAARDAAPLEPEVRAYEATLQAAAKQRYDGLLAAGKLDDALGQLVTLAEARPEVSVASEVANTPELRWRVLQSKIERWGVYAGQLLVLAILALWVAYRLYRRYWGKPRLELADFENTDQAKGIERTIQAMLLNLAQGNGRAAATLQSVSRPIEDAKLPVELSSAVPASWGWANFIPSLAAFVIPPKKVLIRGVLLQDTQRGVGISADVRLANGQGFGETFWATDYVAPVKSTDDAKTAATHHDLAESVAIWLLFRLSGGPTKMLGTHRWQSYAYFRAGVRAEARKDKTVAKAHYLKALQIDDQIHAARLNLAKMATGQEQTLIFGLLRRALQADRADATRYQARYTLASRQCKPATIDAAIVDATALFRDIAETAWQFGLYGVYARVQREVPSHTLHWWQQPRLAWLRLRHAVLTSAFAKQPAGAVLRRLQERRRHHKVERYLEGVLPVILTMWVGVTLQKDPAHAGALETMTRLDGIDHSPNILYNLACVESIRASHSPDASQRDACLQRCLDKLRLALWMTPAIGEKVRLDASLAFARSSTSPLNGTMCSALFETLVKNLVPEAVPADPAPP